MPGARKRSETQTTIGDSIAPLATAAALDSAVFSRVNAVWGAWMTGIGGWGSGKSGVLPA